MKDYIIGENEAGQRLDKYLGKLLREAPAGFYYKMLRKKNITLNGRKASGAEILGQGDHIRLFLSEETIRKFQAAAPVIQACGRLDIIYEDDDFLFANKPVGLLSVPDGKGGSSLTEELTAYLLNKGSLTREEMAVFQPSVCSRLDRNTSGITAAGKTLRALQELSAAIKEHRIRKEYLALAAGKITEERRISAYLDKNPKTNMAVISDRPLGKDSVRIETAYRPVQANGECTLLEVELVTGKFHQIRAQLASLGHPLVGDTKYGDPGLNRIYRDKYGLRSQFLHAYRLTFLKDTIPEEALLSRLSGKVLQADLPGLFQRILQDQKW
ncbi:MAG: RluA family pseudouridine synthase [Blautia sp.]|nr:RluA family pseudouridine synthase [Blautia sp.]